MNTFDEWYAEHHRRLLAVAGKLLGDVQTAADAVADTFMKAWQARERYDGRPVGPWLNTILHNTLVDYRRRRVTLNLPDWYDPAAPSEPAACRLRECVDTLPDDLAAAVRAVYLEDRTFADAAKSLGLSMGCVHKRTSLGIKRLRKILAA